ARAPATASEKPGRTRLDSAATATQSRTTTPGSTLASPVARRPHHFYSSLHLSRKEDVTESNASTNETPSSSGARNSRSLAPRVWINATASPSSASLAISAITAIASAHGVIAVATPHGRNRFANREKNTSSFSPAAHSTSAR